VLVIIMIIIYVIITKMVKRIKSLKILSSLQCKILRYLPNIVDGIYLPELAVMFLYVFVLFAYNIIK
jgi:hypothetical protein